HVPPRCVSTGSSADTNPPDERCSTNPSLVRSNVTGRRLLTTIRGVRDAPVACALNPRSLSTSRIRIPGYFQAPRLPGDCACRSQRSGGLSVGSGRSVVRVTCDCRVLIKTQRARFTAAELVRSLLDSYALLSWHHQPGRRQPHGARAA